MSRNYRRTSFGCGYVQRTYKTDIKRTYQTDISNGQTVSPGISMEGR
jgi:hypothetical protein